MGMQMPIRTVIRMVMMMNEKHITETAFWNDVMDGVYGPRQGGAKIIIDAKNAALGVGKTTAAVALARLFATAFDYELQPEDFCLSGNDYLDRYREHPGKEQPSVLILDDMVGSGAGDKMRTTATKNVNLVRAWQLQRVKRVVTITTLASWADAVKGLRKLADYRLMCLEKPIGYFVPYKLGTFNFSESSKIKFQRLDGRIGFPQMDHDPLYEHVSSLKDELIDSEEFDADKMREAEEAEDPDEVRRTEKLEMAQSLRNTGMSTTQIAKHVGMSQSWVSRYTNANDGGKGQV